MVNKKLLGDLLQEPLGPYYDHDILHETACQMKGGRTRLVLHSFILEHKGEVVGLDRSECPLQSGATDDRVFRFRGILKIANPDWLSDSGLKTVETELNLRAKEYVLREGLARMRVQQLTLNDFFSEKGPLARSNDSTWRKEEEIKLMVQIQGEKNMAAVYMNARALVPNGLLWNSKTHRRNYEIATMNVKTYSLSQNFFWQWRLLALMEKICWRYRYIPEKKRTPAWFVEKYIADFSCPPEDRHQRLVFDDDDTDVDETGKTGTPRHLLRPHRSEVLGLFAAQAGWLILNSEVKSKKLFDLKPWQRFAKAVRRQRKEAVRQNVLWGFPEGTRIEDVLEGESSSDDGDVMDPRKLVKENPVTGKEDATMVRKIELAHAKADRQAKPSILSDSESEGDAGGGAEYASDFSEPSDAEDGDSDYWITEEKALNQIPWQLRLPPFLPDVDGQWWCPLEECSYRIDLHELTEKEERGISEECAKYILQERWRNAAYDQTIMQGFERMVTTHYMKHFEERGVKVEKREGKTRFAFIGDRHRRHGGGDTIRGPMPERGTLGGESRVVPIVHAPRAEYLR